MAVLQRPDLPSTALAQSVPAGPALAARGSAVPARAFPQILLFWSSRRQPRIPVPCQQLCQGSTRHWDVGVWPGWGDRCALVKNTKALSCSGSPTNRLDVENTPCALLSAAHKAINPFQMLHPPNFWMSLNSLLIYSKCLRSYSSTANPIKRTQRSA